MVQELYNARKYPAHLRAELSQLSNQATIIANRWMLSWPCRVRQLLMSGHYMEALKGQLERESSVYDNPGLNHLADHEKLELYGVSLSPP